MQKYEQSYHQGYSIHITDRVFDSYNNSSNKRWQAYLSSWRNQYNIICLQDGDSGCSE